MTKNRQNRAKLGRFRPILGNFSRFEEDLGRFEEDPSRCKKMRISCVAQRASREDSSMLEQQLGCRRAEQTKGEAGPAPSVELVVWIDW